MCIAPERMSRSNTSKKPRQSRLRRESAVLAKDARVNLLDIGDWHFEPRRNRLSKADVSVDLEPMASRLLEVLASEPGRVFSVDELVSEVWGDRIVSDNPVYKAMATLRKALGDTAGDARYVETIRKRGYRLIAEVRPGTRDDRQAVAGDREHNTPKRDWGQPLKIAGALLVALLVLVLALRPVLAPGPDESAGVDVKPRVAVLPFVVSDSATADAYVGPGLARAVAAQLLLYNALTVIGADSSELVAARLEDPHSAGRLLGTRFVVTGTMEYQDQQVLIRVGLVDLENDEHTWRQTFAQSGSGDFYVQHEIAANIASRLTHWGIGVSEQEVEPAAPAASMQAFDAFLRGSYLLRQPGVEQTLEAERWFLEALRLDPNLVDAMNGLSRAMSTLVFYGARRAPVALEQLSPWLERAVEIAPESPDVHVAIGRARYLAGAYEQAEHAYRTALRYQPQHASALQNLAWLLFQSNRTAEALPIFASALKIDPASPLFSVSAAMHAESLSAVACARLLYERAVFLDPKLHNAHYGLGQFEWRTRGDFEQARRRLATAMSLDSRNAITASVLARVALDEEDFETAEAAVAQASEFAPDTYFPRRARMALALRQGDRAEAAALARRQLSFSMDAFALRVLRDEALAQGDAAAAIAVYPEYIRDRDANLVTTGELALLADLSYAFLVDGQERVAREMARVVMRKIDGLPRLPRRGRQLYEVVAAEVLGDRAAALSYLKQAIDAGWHAESWWYLDADPALASLVQSAEGQAMRTALPTVTPQQRDLANASDSGAPACELYDFDPMPITADRQPDL